MSKRQITKATANKVRVYLLLLLELLPGDGVRLVKAGQARRMPLWRMKRTVRLRRPSLAKVLFLYFFTQTESGMIAKTPQQLESYSTIYN